MSNQDEKADCKAKKVTVDPVVFAYTGLASTAMGTLSVIFSHGATNRMIDAARNLYPPPLFSQAASTASSSIFLPLYYFQWNRLSELINSYQDQELDKVFQPREFFPLLHRYHQDQKFSSPDITLDAFIAMLKQKSADFDKPEHNAFHWPTVYQRYMVSKGFVDIYETQHGYGNVLNALCGSNMPSNIPYERNEYIWDKMFMTLLSEMKPNNLLRLLNPSSPVRSPVIVAIDSGKPLYAYALLNAGAVLKPSDVEQAAGWSWLTSSRASTLMQNQTDKKRPLTLFVPSECPITCEPIKSPVMLEDGSIYEWNAIAKWLQKSNTSPLTNVKLSNGWTVLDILHNRFLYIEPEVHIQLQQGWK